MILSHRPQKGNLSGRDARREKLRQKELDFPTKRGERLKLLRQCRVGDALEKLLLRTLDDRIGDGKTWRMGIAELAGEMEVSPATVYRKLASLEAKELLVAEERASGLYEFQVIFSNLPELIPPQGQQQQAGRRRREKPSHCAKEVSQSEKDLSHCAKRTTYKRPDSAQSAHPPSPPEGGSVAEPPPPGGEAVGEPPRRTFRAEEFPIPVGLDTPAFRDAWREWCEFRRHTKRKPISEAAAGKQMAGLDRAGSAAAVEAIEEAIANDWQGLFPDTKKGNSDDRIERKARRAESEWEAAFQETAKSDR